MYLFPVGSNSMHLPPQSLVYSPPFWLVDLLTLASQCHLEQSEEWRPSTWTHEPWFCTSPRNRAKPGVAGHPGLIHRWARLSSLGFGPKQKAGDLATLHLSLEYGEELNECLCNSHAREEINASVVCLQYWNVFCLATVEGAGTLHSSYSSF